MATALRFFLSKQAHLSPSTINNLIPRRVPSTLRYPIPLHFASPSSFFHLFSISSSMADTQPTLHTPSVPNEVNPSSQISNFDVEAVQTNEDQEVEVFDYAKRAQWLRAAVLGANDGLLSTASLMMGVGAVRKDVKTMILTGVAGLVAGACSMALGEYVSVYSQYDIELAQIQREGKDVAEKEKLPSPFQAALASALAFAVGAAVPLLGAAFIKDYKARLGVVVAVVSLALLIFGGLGAVLGKAPVLKSSLRVLIGGWLAMGVTFGLTKCVGYVG